MLDKGPLKARLELRAAYDAAHPRKKPSKVSVGRLIPATHRQVSSSRGMKLNNPLSRYDSQVSSDLGPEFSAADFGFFRVAEPVGGLAGFDSSPSPFCPA